MIKILEYEKLSNPQIIASPKPIDDVSAAVATIVAEVRRDGDAALRRFAERFDKVKLDALRVTEEEIAEGVAAVEEEFLKILERSARNIRE